ncbi:alpha/beta-hydrolase [Trametopsis cervina]|nr:alpha/beta-hydrolase [Trametopsis cervina]
MMHIEPFVFNTPQLEGYAPNIKIAAKRYTSPSAGRENADGFTLICCHGLGQHKEQWDPILEMLFSLHSQRHPRIREAWTFDWQHHGDSALLNADILHNNTKVVDLRVWAAAIAGFIKSGRVDGHRLVGLGFSSGTVAISLSTEYLNGAMSYCGMILIDPSMMDSEMWRDHHKEIQPVTELVSKGAKMRRDGWASREHALKSLLNQYPYDCWDPRIVQVYVDHALYETTDASGKVVVRRKTPAMQEADAFFLNLEITWDGLETAAAIQGRVPIHMVLGTEFDLMPTMVRESMVDKKKGRVWASVTHVEDVGHMVVQEKTDEVTQIISRILGQLAVPEVSARL